MSFAEDYDKCILEAKRLNEISRKETKDESVFDNDKPRKAAMKFKAALGQRVKNKKSADTSNAVDKNHKKVPI